jgi:ectoine hydrolase
VSTAHEPRSRPFSDEEFAGRLAAVQAEMARAGLDALLVSDPANLYYLTGYNAWSFYMPQCLIVPASGEAHLMARAMDAQGAHHTACLPPDRIHGYPETLVHRPDAHPYGWIAARARELGLVRDTVGYGLGVELDAHFFSPRGYLALREALPAATVTDSHELVNWVRVVKSPAEQELLRVAGEMADGIMQVAVEAVQVGRRQCDVVAEIQQAQALGARTLGGDYPAIVPMLPTGATAGTPHLTWSDELLRQHEATTIELAGVRRRYHAPLARTVSLGTPPARLAHCAAATNEGLQAALETMREGVTGREVHAAFQTTIGRHGLTKESRIGYSIGIGYPPDWGEHTVSLRTEEHTVLRAGMALHVILGMWMDGWGYETSQSVLVQREHAELLTRLPPDLTIKT